MKEKTRQMIIKKCFLRWVSFRLVAVSFPFHSMSLSTQVPQDLLVSSSNHVVRGLTLCGYVFLLMCPFMWNSPVHVTPSHTSTLCRQQQPCDPWFDLVWLLCPLLSAAAARLRGLQAAAAPEPFQSAARRQSRPTAFSSVPSEVEQAGGHLVPGKINQWGGEGEEGEEGEEKVGGVLPPHKCFHFVNTPLTLAHLSDRVFKHKSAMNLFSCKINRKYFG